jgi:hypothetical protein
MGVRTQASSLETDRGSDRVVPASASADWRKRGHLDWIIPFLGAASLLAACAIGSRGHYFWNDEIFSWTFLSIQSPWQMLRLIAQGAEVAPPLYHVLGWLWVHVAGSGELSLRLFSSAGVSVALFVTWRMLRRAYPLRAAMLGVLGIFGASGLLLAENGEGRFYGFLLAVVSMGCASAGSLMAEEKPSRSLLAANTVVHAAMAYTHTYGLLYSGAILTAIVAYDVTQRHLRPAVYATVVLAWLLFLPWIPTVLRQAALARPHSQFPDPTLNVLFRSYWVGMVRLPLIGGVIAVLAVVAARTGSWSRSDWLSSGDVDAETRSRRRSMLYLAGGLWMVPLAGFIVSRVSISIFQDRYMLPGVIGWSIVLCHLTSVALSRAEVPTVGTSMARVRGFRSIAVVGWVVLVAALLVNPMYAAWGQKAEVRPGTELEAAMSKAGVTELPVVSEEQLMLLPLRQYARIPRDSIFFVTDWQVATDPRSPRRATVNIRVLELWHRVGLDPSVVDTRTFLCTHRRFVVIDEKRFRWFERRVQHEPAFEWSRIGSLTSPLPAEIILVQDRANVLPACQ